MKRFVFPWLMLVAACSSSSTPTETTDGGVTPVTDAGPTEDSSSPTSCTTAKEALLTPIDSVSPGVVTVLSDTAGVKTLYVDASTGGPGNAGKSPRLYVSLGTAARVDVTDKTAASSTDWDIALRRPILFTNSGDGGPGQGGAKLVDKAFDSVTSADAPSTFEKETFLSETCEPFVDATGAVKTSMTTWYDYEQATMHLTPHAGTWIIKGGSGSLYKVALLSYYANPDGQEGATSARYTLKFAPL